MLRELWQWPAEAGSGLSWLPGAALSICLRCDPSASGDASLWGALPNLGAWRLVAVLQKLWPRIQKTSTQVFGSWRAVAGPEPVQPAPEAPRTGLLHLEAMLNRTIPFSSSLSTPLVLSVFWLAGACGQRAVSRGPCHDVTTSREKDHGWG